MNLEKGLETIKSIRLTGGIFGRTILLLVVLCVAMTAVSIKVDSWWFSLTFMVLMFGLTTYVLKRCLDFAERNPQAAIMESADFLVHEKIVHGMKGERDVLPFAGRIDHPQPLLNSSEVNQDDPPLPQLPVATKCDEGVR